MIHPSYFQNILGYRGNSPKQRTLPDYPSPNQPTNIKTQPIILQMADGGSVEISMNISFKRFSDRQTEHRKQQEKNQQPKLMIDIEDQTNSRTRPQNRNKSEGPEYSQTESQILYKTPVKHFTVYKERPIEATIPRYPYRIKKTQSLSFVDRVGKISEQSYHPQSLFRKRSSEYSKTFSVDKQIRNNSKYDSKQGSIINMQILNSENCSTSKKNQQYTDNSLRNKRRKGLSLMRTKRQCFQNE